MYNWVKTDHVPHTWVTALIQDLALPVNFIGLSTEDRRFLYPIKEVTTNPDRTLVQTLIRKSARSTCNYVHLEVATEHYTVVT